MAEARARGAAAVGARVRWGGRILSVENTAEATWLEVLALALGTDGEPDRDAPSEGRFLARVAGFLDPAVYAPDRLITLVGVLDKPVTRPVGEYPYVYPRLNVDVYYLWPRPAPAPRPDPWCDPWAPLTGYPFGWGGPWPDCRWRP